FPEELEDLDSEDDLPEEVGFVEKLFFWFWTLVHLIIYSVLGLAAALVLAYVFIKVFTFLFYY
ncbi:hypothetical protein ACFLRC_03385, partial [Candidatus Altiarchaeota archaeon]